MKLRRFVVLVALALFSVAAAPPTVTSTAAADRSPPPSRPVGADPSPPPSRPVGADPSPPADPSSPRSSPVGADPSSVGADGAPPPRSSRRERSLRSTDTATRAMDRALSKAMAPPVSVIELRVGGRDSGVGAEVDAGRPRASSAVPDGRAPDAPDAGVRGRRAQRENARRASPSRGTTRADIGKRAATGRKAKAARARGARNTQRQASRSVERPDAGTAASPDAGIAPAVVTPEPSAKAPALQVWEELGERVSTYVPSAHLTSLTDPLMLLGLIALALLVSSVAGRLQARLASRGILPRLLSSLALGGRVAVSLLVLIAVIRAAPPGLRPAVPWMLIAAAVAIGWSLRDLLPDFVAAAVILVERRVRPGTWLTAEGFAGTVDRVGLRTTWLQDRFGQRIAVPNRRLLGSTMSMAGERHHARVRVDSASPQAARRALREAVQTSPWVPVGAPLELRQDSETPALWYVTVRLRRREDGPRFDGELWMRVQAMLATSVAEQQSEAGDEAGDRRAE